MEIVNYLRNLRVNYACKLRKLHKVHIFDLRIKFQFPYFILVNFIELFTICNKYYLHM